MENLTFANVSPIKKWWCSIEAGKSSWYSLIALEVEKPHSTDFIPSAPGSLPSQPHRSLPRCCPSQLVMFWWQRDSPPLHTLGGNPRGKKNIRCHWWKVCFVKAIFTKKKSYTSQVSQKSFRAVSKLYIRILHHLNDLNRWVHGSWIPIKKSSASFPTIPYEWSSQLLVH